MADYITLGNLVELIFKELASTLEQTVNPADLYQMYSEADLPIPEEVTNLQVSDIELDFPAHVQVQADPLSSTKTPQLILTLPSPLETLPVGRLGRVRITIKPEQKHWFE